jgi:L-arabinose isomerase
MLNVELVIIDGKTNIRDFQQQLRTNELYYHLAPGLGNL